MKILISLILIAIAMLFFAHGDRRNTIRVLRTSCSVTDPKEIINVKCYATPINRTYTLGQVYMYLTKTYTNVFIHLKLFKKTDVKYRPFLMDTKEDYCAFFKNNQGSIYLRLIYQMFAPYSNLNHSCPYSGPIIIKDFPMDARLLPSLWPTGVYRIDVHVFNFDVEKFKMEFNMEINE